jgi:MYXO-CTERM domain-containing protein
MIDQTSVDGWQQLGEFTFDEGGYQSVHLGDVTGELPTDNIQIVFDAVRLTRITKGGAADDGGMSDGNNDEHDDNEPGGCAVGGNQLGFLLIGALVALRRRRRR